MLLTLLKFRERVRLVTDIHNQHCITYINMKFIFRQPQISSYTLHITHNPVCIRSTFYQQFTGTEQQVKFTPQQQSFFLLNYIIIRHLLYI